MVFAGIHREKYDRYYGDITWPDPWPVGFYPDAFALVVSGDECSADGIFDLELIFVYPDVHLANLHYGKLYVVRIDDIPHIRRLFEDGNGIILKSSDGLSEDYQPATMQILGEVALHLRRLELGG